jgi:hypothetical protein
MREWSRECREDVERHPDQDRRVVLAFAHVHPLVDQAGR